MNSKRKMSKDPLTYLDRVILDYEQSDVHRKLSASIMSTPVGAITKSIAHILPKQTLSQRRMSSSNSPRYGRKVSVAESLYSSQDGHSDEINMEQMETLLDMHNKRLEGGGTIRMPSDLLYRRKSRIDDGKLFGDHPDEDVVMPEESEQSLYSALNISQVAMMASHERLEEAAVLKNGFSLLCANLKDAYRDITILKDTLRRIQGRFGAAIMEFFSFVKWLILFNTLISVMTLPLIVPQAVLQPGTFEDGFLKNASLNSMRQSDSINCSAQYNQMLNAYAKNRMQPHEFLIDFIQGAGFLENTILFYGSYFNKTYDNQLDGGTKFTYNMPAAFIVVTGLMLVISVILLLWSLSSYMTTAVINKSRDTVNTRFCATVFGWDFGLMYTSAVKLRKRLNRQELTQMLSEKTFAEEKQNRSTLQKVGLYIVRAIMNVLVLATLGASGYAIIVAQDLADTQLKQQSSNSESLFYQYLPSAVITGLYMIVPSFFYIIVKAEKYSPAFEINITIIRIMVIRFASLAVLITNILLPLIKKSCDEGKVKRCGICVDPTANTTANQCWETHLGQQIYKLVVLDLAVLLLVTVLVEYPRHFIYKKLKDRVPLVGRVGQQEFDMPKNVMDVLYSQTLCWIGVLFSPFIPLMTVIRLVVFFAVKRASLFHNQKPSLTLAQSSAVYSFFLKVMLLSLVLAYMVLAVCVQFVPPSQSCGPFRVYTQDKHYMLHAAKESISTWPSVIQKILDYMGSTFVMVLTIMFLCCTIYYYVAHSHGLSHKIKLLTAQLKMSIEDKQFLLNKVNQEIMETNNVNKSSPYKHSNNNTKGLTGVTRGAQGASEFDTQVTTAQADTRVPTAQATGFPNQKKADLRDRVEGVSKMDYAGDAPGDKRLTARINGEPIKPEPTFDQSPVIEYKPAALTSFPIDGGDSIEEVPQMDYTRNTPSVSSYHPSSSSLRRSSSQSSNAFHYEEISSNNEADGTNSPENRGYADHKELDQDVVVTQEGPDYYNPAYLDLDNEYLNYADTHALPTFEPENGWPPVDY